MAMVEDLKKQGKMNNCLALCDVINSTFKVDIPIALRLLVSELSEDPWKGNVISHGDCHEVHFIQGEDVRCKPPRLIIVVNIVAPGRLSV